MLFAFIAGIMIQISLTELIPAAQNYSYPKITKIFFIIGVIFMLVKFFM